MNTIILSQERLKKLLHYCPDTGVFTCLVYRNGIKANREAGGISDRGYRRIKIDGKKHYAQRLAFLYMTGELPRNQVDHINGVRNDNRWCNIRLATAIENAQNRKKRSDNTSGVVGVAWYKPLEKWVASICVDGLPVRLGYFHHIFDAACARKSAELKYGFHPNHGR